MRVAVVLGEFPVLSETFVVNEVAALVENGCKVDVYAEVEGPEDALPVALRTSGSRFRRCSPLAIIAALRARTWKRMGPVLAQLRHVRPLALIRILRALPYGRHAASSAFSYAAAARFRPVEYDVVHAHFGPNGITAAAMRAADVIRGRLVVTFHGYDLSSYLRVAGRDVYGRLFAQVDLCLPVTERWRQRLIELGCDPRRIQVHRVGVNCERFQYIRRDNHSGRQFVAITVGRLVEKKGVEFAIRAIARVAVPMPIRHLIIGDGPERNRLERLTNELNVQDHVQFLGYRDSETVRQLLGTADVMMATSVIAKDGDQEGLPVAIMEAMATGLPVLSTLHSGIPELINDGVEGFLTAERDIDALAQRLQRLVADPELRATMGLAARRRIEEHHNERVLSRRLLELYAGLV